MTSENIISDREKIVNLFHFYKDLLTQKQINYFMDYFFEDHSMTEIAENNNVSKMAISDSIKSISLALLDYETKLKLYEKSLNRHELIDELRSDNIDEIKEKLLELEN